MSNKVTRILLDGVVDDARTNHDARAALRAENAKLREALGKLITLYDDNRDCCIPVTQSELDILDAARAALA